MANGDQTGQAGGREEALPAGLAHVKAPARGMAILDDLGGMLSLDVGSPDVTALRDACQLLLPAKRLGWAGAIKVRMGERCLLVRRRAGEDGAGRIDIADLYDSSQRVSLTNDLVEVLLGVLDGLTRAVAVRG